MSSSPIDGISATGNIKAIAPLVRQRVAGVGQKVYRRNFDQVIKAL
ncbi:MAG TPA: hypothetical protein VE944_13430 [Nostoc sp.]|nr:hypothetical protein [Nostoc sp.]HYX15340.1 hypothetical protein [Nostoc sp.]